VLVRGHLSELADDDGKNQENQDGDDGNSDYFIRSHSARRQFAFPKCSLEKEIQHYLRAICFNVLLLLSV
jgi:hypothetical protein